MIIQVCFTDSEKFTLHFQDHNSKTRTMTRIADEPLNKTRLRLLKVFKIKACVVTIDFQTVDGALITNEAMTAGQVFTQAIKLHVHLTPDNKSTLPRTLTYSVVVNPPRILQISHKDSLCPTCDWPIIPELETERVERLRWEWSLDGQTHTNTSCRFLPQLSDCGKSLSVSVTPIHVDNRVGVPASLKFGAVQRNPLDNTKIPGVVRAQQCQNDEHAASLPPNSFRVMTMNILADQYVGRKSKKSKKNNERKEQEDPEYFNIDYRKHLILQEIIAVAPAIVFLQEVGVHLYHSFLKPHLSLAGYGGRLDLKTTGQDGCGFFYNKEIFQVLKATGITTRESSALRVKIAADELQAMNSIFQLVALRHQTTGRVVICGNSHFYYHPRGEHIRTLQAQLLLMEMYEFSTEYEEEEEDEDEEDEKKKSMPSLASSSRNDLKCGFIVGGDLNATPETACIELLRNGTLSSTTTHRLFVRGVTTEGVSTSKVEVEVEVEKEKEKEKEGMETEEGTEQGTGETKTATPITKQRRHGNYALEWNPVDWHKQLKTSHFKTSQREGMSHPYQFHSTLEGKLSKGSQDQPLTTLTSEFDGTLDWIFVDQRTLRFERVWPYFDKEMLEKCQSLPNNVFPSDHVSVVCEVQFSQEEVGVKNRGGEDGGAGLPRIPMRIKKLTRSMSTQPSTQPSTESLTQPVDTLHTLLRQTSAPVESSDSLVRCVPSPDPSARPRYVKHELHFPIACFSLVFADQTPLLPLIDIASLIESTQDFKTTLLYGQVQSINHLLQGTVEEQNAVLFKLFPRETTRGDSGKDSGETKSSSSSAAATATSVTAAEVRPLLAQARSMLLEHAWNSVQQELKKKVGGSSGSMEHKMTTQQLLTLASQIGWYKRILKLLRSIVEMESNYVTGKWVMKKRLKQLEQVEQLSDELLQWSSKMTLFGQTIILKSIQLHDFIGTIRQVATRQQELFKSSAFIEETKTKNETPPLLHSKRSILRMQSDYKDERDMPYHFPKAFLKQHKQYWTAHIEHTGTLTFEQYIATHPLVLPERVKYLMANDVGTFAKLLDEKFPLSPPPQGVEYIHNWEERRKYEVYVQDGHICHQKSFSLQFHVSENENDIESGEEGNADSRDSTLSSSDDDASRFSAEMVSEMIETGGELLDTRKMDTTPSANRKSGGPGWSMVVYHLKHGLFVGSHSVDKFHHSSFFSGREVTFAGEWMVNDGKVVKICNKSGHYKPGWMETARFLTDLHRKGVDLRSCEFELIGRDFVGDLCSAPILQDSLLAEECTSRIFKSAEKLRLFLQEKLTDVNVQHWLERSRN